MLKDFQYYICFNGCQVIDNKNPDKPDTLTSTLLDKKMAEKIVNVAKSQNIPCYAITPERVLWEHPVVEAATEAHRNFENIQVQDLSNLDKDEQVVKIVLSLPEDPERMQKFYDALGEIDSSIKENYTIIRPDDHNIEFLPKDAGKSPAVLALKEKLNADRAITFGDAGNDYDMIRDADYGICMGNGAPKCKEAAYMVTLDNSHDGIAYAVDELMKVFEKEEEKEQEETLAIMEDEAVKDEPEEDDKTSKLDSMFADAEQTVNEEKENGRGLEGNEISDDERDETIA